MEAMRAVIGADAQQEQWSLMQSDSVSHHLHVAAPIAIAAEHGNTAV